MSESTAHDIPRPEAEGPRPVDRRTFVRLSAAGLAGSAGLAGRASLAAADHADPPASTRSTPPGTGRMSPEVCLAVKYAMFSGPEPIERKLAMLREIGFDGVETDAPGVLDPASALAASEAAGLPIHGVVDCVHWQDRLSSPDPAIREKGRIALARAIEEAHAIRASSVLLVPGVVADERTENHRHVRDRSIEAIRTVLPLAARLGVHVLIENVWNGFCYDPAGDDRQTADRLAAYIDEIASPWVGVYFDIGNVRRWGRPEAWIRTLGRRIVKLDVKDWSRERSFCPIGEGDVDWPAVRDALAGIGFTGWATAEVAGGDRSRMEDVHRRMTSVLRPGA